MANVLGHNMRDCTGETRNKEGEVLFMQCLVCIIQ